jgi:hypothetical protein
MSGISYNDKWSRIRAGASIRLCFYILPEFSTKYFGLALCNKPERVYNMTKEGGNIPQQAL